MPERRTIVVLTSLVVGMTLVSGALMLLQPTQSGPLPAASLSSIDTRGVEGPDDQLVEPLSKFSGSETPWRVVVIHGSRGLTGSMEDLDRAYRQAGAVDSGYHLVINNGTGKRDGTIEVSQRWMDQEAGAYVDGDQGRWFNEHGIGVCLVEDKSGRGYTPAQLRELGWAVRVLCERLSIGPAQVHIDLGPGSPDAERVAEAVRRAMAGL
ncbi:MAG: peptidoglycan recognition family protein [Planctomycetota bacterium]